MVLAASAGVEACDPFMDKRVVDYCSSLPGRLRQRDGWPKAILRDLTEGRLPDEVRRARGKHHVGWVFNAAVTESAARAGKVTSHWLERSLGEYVSSEKLLNAWAILEAGEDAEPIHSAFVLATWLRENETRPVVTRGPKG